MLRFEGFKQRTVFLLAQPFGQVRPAVRINPDQVVIKGGAASLGERRSTRDGRLPPSRSFVHGQSACVRQFVGTRRSATRTPGLPKRG